MKARRKEGNSTHGSQGHQPRIQVRSHQWPGIKGRRPPSWIYLVQNEMLANARRIRGEACLTVILVITATFCSGGEGLPQSSTFFRNLSHHTTWPVTHSTYLVPALLCLTSWARPCACWKKQGDSPDLSLSATWLMGGATFVTRLKESGKSQDVSSQFCLIGIAPDR